MNTKITTNLPLLRHLIQKDLLGQYSYFLRFKYQFTNSLYYNFNINRISKIHGISHACTKRKLNFFLKAGWCFVEHNHLKFVSLKQLCLIEGVVSKCPNSIEIRTNCKEIKRALQRIILEDDIRKQEFICRIKQDLNNPTNLKAYKAAKRKAARYNVLPGEIAEAPMISTQRMSTLFHCSNTTAINIKRDFIRYKWFGFLKQTEVLATGVSNFNFKKFWRPYYNNAVYLFKSVVYRSKPSLVYKMAE